ncbi:unnamed protein product [Sphenostylis stenocarpa]|uniref:Uncharacterized protein n=1 Tax=Sphenostylis stenocarpa TaxID=92480 RepID=A0AA86T6D0_9FABA|nr:unnamed protein product [Sphenostylis stenocarpa]
MKKVDLVELPNLRSVSLGDIVEWKSLENVLSNPTSEASLNWLPMPALEKIMIVEEVEGIREKFIFPELKDAHVK